MDGVGGTTSITLNQLYLILFTSTNLCLRKKLGKCYEKGGIVPGTRSCHQFCPLSSDKTAYKRWWIYRYTLFSDAPILHVSIEEISRNGYVTCYCDSSWWIGLIPGLNEKERDAKMNFMDPLGPS